MCIECFFFQAEDGIRDAQASRGFGDVYKRQGLKFTMGLGVARPTMQVGKDPHRVPIAA